MYTLQISRLAWHHQNIIYFILDISWAFIASLIVYELNPDRTTQDTLLVWGLTLLFFWQTSATPIRFFSQSYRHPVRLACSVCIVALVYFFVLRAEYSIVSLGLVSVCWVLGALSLRLFLANVKPAQRIVGHPQVLDQLSSHPNLSKVACAEPSKIDLDHFDGVVFDPTFSYSSTWQDFFVHVTTVGVPVFGLTELQELVYGKVPVELLQKSWIDHSFVVNKFYLKLKRFIDLSFSLVLLPVTLLLSMVIALLSKIFMGGDVFFIQPRMGLGGDVFNIYKFRTMTDIKFAQQGAGDDHLGHNEDRVTKFGKILRLFRLDELPQFLNVIKGEMSLIGPRPEWLASANKFAKEIPLYQLRHIVRPGITGWAQVQQGHITGTTGNYEKLRYDIYYVKNCSIWLDCKILMKTLQIMITGRGI